MPPRTTRPTGESTYIKRAVPHHAAIITILWVVLFFLALGFVMVLLVQSARISVLERYLDAVVRQESDASQSLQMMGNTVDMLNRTCVKVPSASLPTTLGAPTTNAADNTLTRGSASPDGKKVAGYDDVTAGKKGIGVRVIGETKIRHVVIFNPKTESSGAGTADAAAMSVRWTDSQTIEYDVLTKKADGSWVRGIQTVKIYF